MGMRLERSRANVLENDVVGWCPGKALSLTESTLESWAYGWAIVFPRQSGGTALKGPSE